MLAWEVVARGMPGSTSEAFRSSIYDPNANWTPLEGWKEIGAYLQRTERTAKRWELKGKCCKAVRRGLTRP